MPSIAIGNRIDKRFSWPLYWNQHLDLEYTSRSGNEFLETRSGLNLPAKILTAAAKFDATHYITHTVANFGSTTSRVPIIIKFYYTGAATNEYLFCSCDEALATKYFILACYSGKLAIRVYNVSPAISNACNADAALTVGWHTVIFDPTGNIYTITDNGVALTVGAGLTMSVGSNNGTWIEDVLGRDNITFGCLKRNALVTSTLHYLDYIAFGTANKWIIGKNGYCFDVIGGVHLTWTTASQFIWDANAGSHFLDVGFSVYTKSGSNDMLVPYTSAGVPCDASAFLTPLSYTFSANYPGYTDGIMKTYAPPCLVGFNETGSADSRLEIFDRSNTTRQEDISRSSSYYDATSLATKCRYHSSEILYIANLMALYKVGYKHRVAPVNDDLNNPVKVTGFLVAKTDML